jgi:hypothetical protein
MAFEIVYLGTNIVCTNMTCGVPRKIGCIEQPRFEQYRADCPAPIMTYRDTKISACFECRLTKSFRLGIWSNMLGLVLGLAAAVLVVVAVGVLILGTGGLGALAMGTVSFLVAESLKWTAIIATATLVGTEKYYGYRLEHDCDVVSSMTWDAYHRNIKVKGNYVIVDRSLLECPQGGLITIIMDDAIAQEAASMLTAANKDVISKKRESEFWQGMASGATCGLNPLSLAISSGFHFYEWFVAKSHHNEMYNGREYSGDCVMEHSGELQIGAGVLNGGRETIKDAKPSYEAVKNASKDLVAQKKGYERLAQKAAEKNTKAAAKHALIQKQNVDKISAKRAQEASKGWKKFASNIAKIGLGVLGGIAAMKIAEAYDKEIEFTERGMITKLQETINKDRRKAGGPITTYSLN